MKMRLIWIAIALAALCLTPASVFAADSDNDGIEDQIEDKNGDGVVDKGETDPNNPDSDGDGIPDGVEDANKNGIVDPGETDPTQKDTDKDLLPDGIEDRDGDRIVDPGETDPLNPDTDGDGELDGNEDANQNGKMEYGERNPLVPGWGYADSELYISGNDATGCRVSATPSNAGAGLLFLTLFMLLAFRRRHSMGTTR